MSALKAFGRKKIQELLDDTERATEGSGAPLQGEDINLKALSAASGKTPRVELARRLDLSLKGPAPVMVHAPSFGPGGASMPTARRASYQQQQQPAEVLVAEGSKSIH